MDQSEIRQLLHLVRQGTCTIDQAIERLKHFPAETLDNTACIDHQRSLRTGMPEVIYGASKTAEQIITIAESLLHSGAEPVLVTKVDLEKARAVLNVFPQMTYHQEARMLSALRKDPEGKSDGRVVAIISAGSSDIPIAEEAVVTAESLGNPIVRIYDVGVAGLHRLLAHRKVFDQASVIIAVAGMEGALPSVVAGLVECPVIGVPTSIGYGTSFRGISALLSMLNSCAPGLAVVNIDNGFGAACMAHAINRSRNRST